ncbi:MAG: glycosyltransferase family 1 protein [Polyangiales bacterium]
MQQTVFINGRFLGQRLTGVQRYAHESLRALDALVARGEAGPDVRFEVLAPPGVKSPELTAIAFRNVGRLRGNAWEQLSLPRAAKASLLLGFGPTGPAVKASQIVTVHDAAVHVVPRAFSWRFRAWYKVLLPVLVRRSVRVMTVSHFSRGQVARYFKADARSMRVSGEGWQHVLRIPSDLSVLSRHGLTNRRYVLVVGSLSPHKNLEVVARAAALLSGAPLHVVVAGAVNERVFGAGAPRGSVLKLLGYVSEGELRALYEHAAAFVHPSLYEGFGLPPLEAMALNCPVIASNAAAIPETCGDAALYFEPQRAEQLAQHIERVVGDPRLRDALLARASAQLARHSWEGAAARQLAVVREALSTCQSSGVLGAPTVGVHVDAPRAATEAEKPYG